MIDINKIKPTTGTRTPLKDVVPLQEPYALYIYPTNRCNFRCKYCVHSLQKSVLEAEYGIDNRDMTLKTFKNAVDGLFGMGSPLKTMVFVGQGEPLLNRDLAQMIGYAKKKKATNRTEIITNASLLTHELTDELLSAGLDVLRVSLQGLTSESYKNICNAKVDFGVFLEQLTYFFDNKRDTQLYVKVIDEALEEGDEALFYETFDPISDRMFIEKVKPVYAGVHYKENPDEVTVDRYGNAHAPRYVCPLPFYMITVWPDGSVAPCEAIYKPVTLGNVNEHMLLDLWQGAELMKFWQDQLRYGKNSFNRCLNCCAPDDVSHSLDILDDDRETILQKML